MFPLPIAGYNLDIPVSVCAEWLWVTQRRLLPVVQYIQNSGQHPLCVRICVKNKAAECSCIVKRLRWFWFVRGGNEPTVQRQTLICWIALVQKTQKNPTYFTTTKNPTKVAYAAVSFGDSHLGLELFSAKSFTVLYSYRYSVVLWRTCIQRDRVGSTLS